MSPRFSERLGLRPVKVELQIDTMDEDLRNGLWNLLNFFYWKPLSDEGWYLSANPLMRGLCYHIWHNYFKDPIDTLDDHWRKVLQVLRDYFFEAEWYEVYDFCEFVTGVYSDQGRSKKFAAAANDILERELSAFRFVDGLVTRVIDQEEIQAIEEAASTPSSGARAHIRRSLELLADRQAPDYRNSIKESISAVESICREVTDDRSATLGRALSTLRKESRLHPALEGAFKKLYGYTSDEEGIRHALLKESSPGFDEAKFMLVACSAFVNYVLAKSQG